MSFTVRYRSRCEIPMNRALSTSSIRPGPAFCIGKSPIRCVLSANATIFIQIKSIPRRRPVGRRRTTGFRGEVSVCHVELVRRRAAGAEKKPGHGVWVPCLPTHRREHVCASVDMAPAAESCFSGAKQNGVEISGIANDAAFYRGRVHGDAEYCVSPSARDDGKSLFPHEM